MITDLWLGTMICPVSKSITAYKQGKDKKKILSMQVDPVSNNKSHLLQTQESAIMYPANHVAKTETVLWKHSRAMVLNLEYMYPQGY